MSPGYTPPVVTRHQWFTHDLFTRIIEHNVFV